MDGQRTALEDAQTGENLPPLHPNCRCMVVPVVEEEAARDVPLRVDAPVLERRVLVDGEYIKPMPKSQLHKVQKAFMRKGGILQADDASSALLSSRSLAGITYNENTILLGKNPTRATVFEELIHTAQYKNGENKGDKLSVLKCEIAAKEKLLRYAEAYGLTPAEIRETKKLFAKDREQMVEYKRREGC